MSDHVSAADHRGLVTGMLRLLTAGVLRFPRLALLACIGSAAACGWYTTANLKFKTSRADLISPAADYQQRWLRYTKLFGDVSDMVVVVEGDSPEIIAKAVTALGRRAEKETDHFRSVFHEVNADRLKSKGLQYLPPDELQRILDQLGEYGPLLRGNRFGLLTISKVVRNLGTRIEETNAVEGLAREEVDANLAPLFEQVKRVAGSLDLFLQNQTEFVSPWPDLVERDPRRDALEARLGPLMNSRKTMGFIKVTPVVPPDDFAGATAAIDRMRTLMEEVGREHPHARFGLTGIPVLENDEMRSSQASMFDASVVSFLGVALLMVIGFRGVRYPLMAQALLMVALAWSFGWAAASVGHLNILSVSFTAMLIGLGIDYATIYLIKYLDLRHKGWGVHGALMESVTSVGPGTLVAAASTAAAFAVALLTDFTGVAELGVIAGGGILLAVVCSFILLPAMIALLDRRFPVRSMPSPFSADKLRRGIARHPLKIMAAFALLLGLVAPHGFPVKYDTNLLNLQARGLPSVEIQQRIFEQSDDGSILFAVSMAASPKEALDLKAKFEKLPSVHHVVEVASMLPAHPSEEVRLMVQGIHETLSQLPETPPVPGRLDPSVVGAEFEQIEGVLKDFTSSSALEARVSVSQFLDRLEKLPVSEQVSVLRDFQFAMTSDLLDKLHEARKASNPDPVTVADLPPALASRFLSESGQWLLQVFPKSELWDEEPLAAFIKDVRSVDPEATGTPLQTHEATRAIFRGYLEVGLYALGIVVVMLLLDLRSLTDALLALVPPLAGGVMTLGMLGLAGVPLNPANLIILPLIVGIGVDGGVHVLHDFRARRGSRYRVSGSVFGAIVLNQLTTVVGFGSLMMAAHRGLFSLGFVLTLGVVNCMVVAVVLLPAMLVFVARSRYFAEVEEYRLEMAEAARPVSASRVEPTGERSPPVGAIPNYGVSRVTSAAR